MFGFFMRWRVRGALKKGPVAGRALGPKGAPALTALLGDKRLADAASRALVALGGAARPALVKSLKKPGSRAQLHRALTTLGRLRPKADPQALIEFMQDASPRTRLIAARAISRQGGPRAHQAMAVALRDDDPAVRDVALAHLTRTSDPRAVRLVIAAVAHEDEAIGRACAARIQELGYLAAGPLVDSLRTSDPAMRRTVAYLIDGLCDDDSLVILSKALEEDDERIWPVVRDAFVRKGPMASHALVPLAGHPDPVIRSRAVGILATWRTPALDPVPGKEASLI